MKYNATTSLTGSCWTGIDVPAEFPLFSFSEQGECKHSYIIFVGIHFTYIKTRDPSRASLRRTQKAHQLEGRFLCCLGPGPGGAFGNPWKCLGDMVRIIFGLKQWTSLAVGKRKEPTMSCSTFRWWLQCPSQRNIASSEQLLALDPPRAAASCASLDRARFSEFRRNSPGCWQECILPRHAT